MFPTCRWSLRRSFPSTKSTCFLLHNYSRDHDDDDQGPFFQSTSFWHSNNKTESVQPSEARPTSGSFQETAIRFVVGLQPVFSLPPFLFSNVWKFMSKMFDFLLLLLFAINPLFWTDNDLEHLSFPSDPSRTQTRLFSPDFQTVLLVKLIYSTHSLYCTVSFFCYSNFRRRMHEMSMHSK